MSKTKDLARNFLKKAVNSESNFKESFEITSPTNNPTIGIPVSINLTQDEVTQIRKILSEEYRSETISDNSVDEHIKKISDITQQIKSISVQSVLLHGQRIKEAQEILKEYKDGAFTKWLMTTYGNRQTPYSMLNYYDLYQSIPLSHKAILESTPKKAVYLLASKKGDLSKKIEILESHSKSKQKEIISAIQETFPSLESDRRKSKGTNLIHFLDQITTKIEKRQKSLTQVEEKCIKKILDRLTKLCY